MKNEFFSYKTKKGEIISLVYVPNLPFLHFVDSIRGPLGHDRGNSSLLYKTNEDSSLFESASMRVRSFNRRYINTHPFVGSGPFSSGR